MPNIVLITGASSGLGREFARQVDAGAIDDVTEIWAVARRADRLEALVRTSSTPVRPFCLDLTDPISYSILESALAETACANVRLLVNNAGIAVFGRFARQRQDAAPRMAQLLMRAPVELIYRVLPYMRSGSRIIDISSVAAFLPQPDLAVYAAAKRFILDVTRALNAELEDVGICATAVCPKFMKTEFLDDPGDASAARQMSAIGFERIDRVARAALKASEEGRDLCIPALDMRVLYALTHVIPYRVLLGVQRSLASR
ncbi:short-chain dehydrogenase/reductase SDR [Coriobacterium glomerans PW2]|uniref:Short-chain dehydrogenase/reductase SDR n=1 Tax=Coriobacterium glomerans (strain ATCC 49209 / DSM 20642 / JCM 10262 / PW2) TaxID=700015 RepID=F2N865_CORGP|nr:SDR family NAD(P)-dependent oxidoreductase [Coriobacterium glomerans]AEB07248.1 short-chain dehydrogenase/reductase SDR [Coriobacterium glomerans PW2]